MRLTKSKTYKLPIIETDLKHRNIEINYYPPLPPTSIETDTFISVSSWSRQSSSALSVIAKRGMSPAATSPPCRRRLPSPLEDQPAADPRARSEPTADPLAGATVIVVADHRRRVSRRRGAGGTGASRSLSSSHVEEGGRWRIHSFAVVVIVEEGSHRRRLRGEEQAADPRAWVVTVVSSIVVADRGGEPAAHEASRLSSSSRPSVPSSWLRVKD